MEVERLEYETLEYERLRIEDERLEHERRENERVELEIAELRKYVNVKISTRFTKIKTINLFNKNKIAFEDFNLARKSLMVQLQTSDYLLKKNISLVIISYKNERKRGINLLPIFVICH